MILFRTSAVLLGLACGCASRTGALHEAPDQSQWPRWTSTLHREHPLVGRVWDVRASRWTDERALEAALAEADFVLLGEIHDNPDHHLLQARMVRELVSTGRRPALAFEMLYTTQQSAVDAALTRRPRSADSIADAVDWARSGWPDFAMYRPVFAAGIRAGLPIVAANLPAGEVHDLVARGLSALALEPRQLLERVGPLPEDVARGMRQEMQEAHCGELPDSMLEPMVLAQRGKDAQMAVSLLSAGAKQGAILITGSGHARVDRGVPLYLSRGAPARKVVTVAFLEVSPADRTPDAYAAQFGSERLPFHYAVFTPATDRGDPCEGMRKRPRRIVT
jgi:uncharacterized iron-regulated protein